MNILLLTNYFPPEIGSASHLFYDLSKSLVKKGYKVTVVTGFPRYHVSANIDNYEGKFYLSEVLEGICVIRLKTSFFPRSLPVFRGVDFIITSLVLFFGGLISGRHDAILVYSPPLPLALIAYCLSRLKGIPLLVNVQDLFPQSIIDLGLLKNRFLIYILEGLERFLYGRATYITVHSDGNREHVIKKGACPDKVLVVPNWVDTETLRPAEKVNGFRKEHGLDSQFLVSFAGVMGYSQDLDTVIEAASLLRSYKDILFVLIGDGVAREGLERKVKALGLNNVRFLPMQSRDKYPSILQASDVCLVTLWKKVATPVVPSKLLSIMACGRAVVGSLPLHGDAPRIIMESSCGLCIEPENPNKLARAVLHLYKNPAEVRAFGIKGRDYAVKHFSLETCTQKYEELFKEAVSRWRP